MHTQQKTASRHALCYALHCFASLFFLSCVCAPHVLSLVAFSNNSNAHILTRMPCCLFLRGDPTTTTGSPRLLLGLRCCCSFAATLCQGHPTTLAARSNLAFTLQKLGEVRRAEEEYQAVLEARIVQRGSDHADTLNSMWNLGALLAADCFARPLGVGFVLFPPAAAAAVLLL
jgi:hypothetical protein